MRGAARDRGPSALTVVVAFAVAAMAHEGHGEPAMGTIVADLEDLGRPGEAGRRARDRGVGNSEDEPVEVRELDLRHRTE